MKILADFALFVIHIFNLETGGKVDFIHFGSERLKYDGYIAKIKVICKIFSFKILFYMINIQYFLYFSSIVNCFDTLSSFVTKQNN